MEGTIKGTGSLLGSELLLGDATVIFSVRSATLARFLTDISNFSRRLGGMVCGFGSLLCKVPQCCSSNKHCHVDNVVLTLLNIVTEI